MPSLVPCTACARHVRTSDASCPFCGAPVSAAPAAKPEPGIERALTRAAITFAAAAAVSACGKTDGKSVNIAPAYGPPPITETTSPEGGATDDAAAPSPTPEAVPAYGAPPIDTSKRDE